MRDLQMSQSMILGFQGLRVTPETREFIQTYQPAGFIFFKDNSDTLEQVFNLLSDLKKYYQKTFNLDPWLCIDHEGGSVHRLPPPVTHFPPAEELADGANPESLYDVGKQMAIELKALGFNVNFAPVCDIRQPQTHCYLTSRTFGSDPQFVAECCKHLVLGLQQNGIMACAKHFPGIGSAEHDPHEQLIMSNQSIETFNHSDWVPFKHLIQHNIDAIMTSHILCKHLDHKHMATLSTNIVTEMLVNQLTYKALVFSDDIKMGAIQNDVTTTTLEAFIAGHHLMIYSERSHNQNAVLLDEINQISKKDGALLKRLKTALNLSKEKLTRYRDETPNKNERLKIVFRSKRHKTS